MSGEWLVFGNSIHYQCLSWLRLRIKFVMKESAGDTQRVAALMKADSGVGELELPQDEKYF